MVICAQYVERDNPRYVACDTWEQALEATQQEGLTLLSLLLLTYDGVLPEEGLPADIQAQILRP